MEIQRNGLNGSVNPSSHVVTVYNDEMSPIFERGDRLVLREIKKPYKLIFGKPVVVLTIGGTALIRYIYENPTNANGYILLTTNKRLPPMYIEASEIASIYRIVGRFVQYEM